MSIDTLASERSRSVSQHAALDCEVCNALITTVYLPVSQELCEYRAFSKCFGQ